MDSFEHYELGPLPIDPKLLRLQSEVESWRKKYEQVFQEQCASKSIDNHLRESLRAATSDRDKFKAKSEALMELLKELCNVP